MFKECERRSTEAYLFYKLTNKPLAQELNSGQLIFKYVFFF